MKLLLEVNDWMVGVGELLFVLVFVCVCCV